MTRPLEIMIGLHYSVSPTEYAADNPRHRDSEPTRRALDDFVARGMLVRLPGPNKDGATFVATEAMTSWIEELTKVPLPPRVIEPDAERPRPTGP